MLLLHRLLSHPLPDFSKEFNPKGYHFPILSAPEACTGCDLCGLYCPDFAIFGEPLKDIDERQTKGTSLIRAGRASARAT